MGAVGRSGGISLRGAQSPNWTVDLFATRTMPKWAGDAQAGEYEPLTRDVKADGDEGGGATVTRRKHAELVGHEGGDVQAVACTEKYMITADAKNGHLYIWDAQNCQEKLFEIKRVEQKRIYGIAVSPNKRLVAAASYDNNSAFVYDIESGECVQRILGAWADKEDSEKLGSEHAGGHSGGVWDVAFTHDGKGLVTGGGDFTARIWEFDVPDSKRAICRHVLTGHTYHVRSVACSPHEAGPQCVVATASWDGTVRTWEANTGELLHVYREHGTERVNSVVYSPCGSTFATACDSGTAIIFEVPSDSSQKARAVGYVGLQMSEEGAENDDQRASRKGEASKIQAVAYSPDGRSVATACDKYGVRIWDLSVGEVVHQLGSPTGSQTKAVAFARDGERVLTGGNSKVARVWDTFSHGVFSCRYDGHTNVATSIAIAPDFGSFVSTGFDQSVRHWKVGEKEGQGKQIGECPALITCCGYHRGARYVVSGRYAQDKTGAIDIWDMQNAETADPAHTITGISKVQDIDFSPDGKSFLVAFENHTATIYDFDAKASDVKTSCKLRVTLGRADNKDPTCGHTAIVSCGAYSSDGNRVVTGSWDKRLIVWDGTNGDLLCTLAGDPNGVHGHGWWVKDVAFDDASGESTQPTLIISAGSDNTARVWQCGAPPDQVAGTGGVGGTEQASEQSDQREPWHLALTLGVSRNTDPTKGHITEVWAARFLPDRDDGSKRAITGSQGGQVIVWNLDEHLDEERLERSIWLSGPASCIELLQHDRVLTTSGDTVFQLDLSAPKADTMSGEDLLHFAIMPDLKEGKSTRSTRVYDLYKSSPKHGQDLTGCMLQPIGVYGETALHMAVEQGNRDLAVVLCGAKGGTVASVVRLDACGRTAWSIDLHKYEHTRADIDAMSEDAVQNELRTFGFEKELKKLEEDLAAEQKKGNRSEEISKCLRNAKRLICAQEDYPEHARQMGYCKSLGAIQSGVFYGLPVAWNARKAQHAIEQIQGKMRDQGISGNEVVGEESPELGTFPDFLTVHPYQKPMQFLECMLEHVDKASAQDRSQIFGSLMAHALVGKAWEQYGSRHFRVELFLYLVVAICLSAGNYLRINQCDDANSNHEKLSPMSWSDLHDGRLIAVEGLSIVAVLGLLRLLYLELTQCVKDGTKYLKHFWNVYQLLSYVLALLSVGAYSSQDCESSRSLYARHVHAFGVGLIWFGMLFYLRGFKSTQAAVPMINRIIIDVFPYILLLVVILIGCSFMFMNLQDRSDPDNVQAQLYVNPILALLNSFYMMFSLTDVPDFSSHMTIAVFVVFMMIVQLVLLNMLIAIMGDSVDFIQEIEAAIGNEEQAELLLEFHDNMHDFGKAVKVRWAWLDTVVRVFSRREAGTTGLFSSRSLCLAPGSMRTGEEWNGHVDAIKSEISEAVGKVETGLHQRIHALEDKLDSSLKEILDRLGDLGDPPARGSTLSGGITPRRNL
eukprot:COSAG02_NODE_901_length_16056_cov_52.549477_1_plen_1463_part_00